MCCLVSRFEHETSATVTERQIGLRKRTRPFTQIPNDVVDDFTISYRELGLLVRILRMPEGFVIRSEQLANEGKGKTLRGRPGDREGREAVRTTLRKLALAGYYRLVRIRFPDGTFAMATDISEDPVETWASQAAVFGGKPVLIYRDKDGNDQVKYPDGTILPDDTMPPKGMAHLGEQDPGDDGDEEEEAPKPGNPSSAPKPGNPSPGDTAPGEAAPGDPDPLKKMVSKDGQKDSVPAPQVRRGGAEVSDSDVDGQLTIDGGSELSAEQLAKKLAAERNATAMGLGRAWLELRAEHNCPLIRRGSMDPLHALRNVLVPALEAHYTENEIKFALTKVDRAIPTANAVDDALAAVRRGWRPVAGWKPGDAGAGVARGVGRQRQGSGAMANTNLHVDDLSEEQRQEENPFRKASRQSHYLGTEQRGAVA